MDEKKYQIFVSSTYKDLIDAREAVAKTVLSMYHFPIGMEMFSAADAEQWKVISETIGVSDYYVVIIGHRYGSETSEGISFTEKEYDYARLLGIPVLTFIRNREAVLQPEERDNDPDKLKKLDAFIAKATANKMCDYWDSTEELAKKVAIALHKELSKNPRIGWVRADKVASAEVTKEFSFDNPSMFCSETEPLATINGANGSDNNIFVPNTECLFLRIIPINQVDAIKSTKEAYELLKSGQLMLMGRNYYDGYRFIERNRHGAVVCGYEDNKAARLSQLFLNNQIWGIDLETINRDRLMKFGNVKFGYFPSLAIEEAFNATLDNYLKFASSKLGLSTPLKYIAGAAGVENFKMTVNMSGFTDYGGGVKNKNIVYKGQITDYKQKTTEILRPLFNHIWEECGLDRPDMEFLR